MTVKEVVEKLLMGQTNIIRRCKMKLSKYFSFSLMAFILIGIIFITPVLAQEKVVKMALKASDIRSLDPHYGTTTIDYGCISPMFNGLVRFKPADINPEKIEPDLAERWERSKDGLVWTFHLRKGVMFHKGYGELTSEDVKFSLEKAANKATSGFAADYAALDKVEALDKYTVRLTFKSAIPSVLGILTDYHGGYIVSKKAVLERGDKFKFDPIGTGPFMMKEYAPKEKVVEVRHPEFFRGKPKLDRAELWFMPDASSREMAFRKGEIDIVEGEREQAWVKKIREVPGTAIEIFGPGETLVLHFNMTKKPLDDIRVRRAICHAINLKELMAFLGPDVTEKLVSPIPMNYLGGTDKVPSYEFSPEKAKKLLAEAGYPKGFDMSMVITEMSDYRRPMEQVQEQLRRVGINLKMDVITHTAFHEQIRKDVNPLVLYVAARFPIADPFLTQFYYSKSIVGTPTAITNFSHYNKIDDLIEKARVEVDLKKQKAIWAEAQKKIIEDAVALPLCITKFVFARKVYVDIGYELGSTLDLVPSIKWTTDIRK
jgi:peptide/nickel transport system substrate-binding protein